MYISNICLKYTFEMTTLRNMSKDTREKLIDAALSVFAEQGYQNATVQQIVERAGTNISAINYHFGDKATFYGHVVSYALAETPCSEQADLYESQSPEDQLRTFISWFIRNAIGLNSQPSFLDSVHVQEMMNPSPILDEIVENFIRPKHMKLRDIVTALLPDNATEQQIRHHCFSVVGQCLHYKFARPVMERLYTDIEFNSDYAEQLANHIAQVSLAGMRAMHEVKT